MSNDKPWKYTPEKCHELAESLKRYFSDPESLYLESWACRPDVGISMRQLRLIVAQNEEFAAAWEWVATVQGSRLLELSTRPRFTEKGSVYYRANPQIARLVLASKHGYSEKHDLEITNLDGADRTPSTPEEIDNKIKELEEQKQYFRELEEQCRSIGVVFAGQTELAFLPETTTEERTNVDDRHNEQP